jgi:hypothetical protein
MNDHQRVPLSGFTEKQGQYLAFIHTRGNNPPSK